ncbi:MAG: adenylyl-sulfate kinase [Cyanobacteria bacterium NC_groundwater_1444_Ag_S-0.65um_54_12]|nr:adenylyl-sulfate kinase [Cyanobacteria bacterium NC_groundwater_1444_Ag_S-0.65um_54_12]
MVIWITGLSGAGKSSIARTVIKEFRNSEILALLLDGDDVRSAIADPNLGYDRNCRLTNAYRLSRLANLVEKQGILVVVATMSLFHEIHRWNRENFSEYIEVYVKVNHSVLEQRDARNLYSRAARGEVTSVVGVHLEYDEPIQPHLIIENNEPVEDFTVFGRKIIQLAFGKAG